MALQCQKPFFTRKMFLSALQKTDDNESVAGRVIQLTGCSDTQWAFCRCSATVKYREESTCESDELSEEACTGGDSETEQMPRSFPGLILPYSDK